MLLLLYFRTECKKKTRPNFQVNPTEVNILYIYVIYRVESLEFDFVGLLCTFILIARKKKKRQLERRQRETIVNRSVCHNTTACYRFSG